MRQVGLWHWTTIVLAALLTFVALAHSFEDFAHDVPRERFGLDATPTALMLSGAFLVQGAAIALAWARRTVGYVAMVLVAVAWFVAAILDHTGDLLNPTFRTVTSDVLITGIILTSVLTAVTGTLAARARDRRA